MVIVLLLIIIFLLAPWLLGLLGVVAVGAWGVISVGISIAAAIGLVFFVIAYLNHLRKATPEERKKELKILGIVLVVTASIVGIIASTISNTNNNHYLEMGKINLSYSVTEADEWFSKLPRSHNQEIIHVCMNMVENHKGFTSFYDNDMLVLDLAEKYSGDDVLMKDKIQDLRLEYTITTNRGADSRKRILDAYASGRITADEAVQYAVDMYNCESKEWHGQKNAMRDDAIALVEAFADKVPLAEEKFDEWSILPREYQQAIDWVNAHENYQEAAEWFAAHLDYKHSSAYLSLCTGVNNLCGVWKYKANTLEIAVDTTQKVKMSGDSPQKIYLKMTFNGRDISYYHDTLWSNGVDYQCHIKSGWVLSDGSVRYDFSYGGWFNPYMIHEIKEGSINFTHNTAERINNSYIYQDSKWTYNYSKVE